jgi:hypothetical protein
VTSSIVLNAQLCNGSLGENIFIDGDFGSGVNPIVQQDPMISPAYTYTTSLVNDGYYSLVTNTSNWSNLYPSWVRTADNSGTNTGYMMVVNASFTPGVFYEKTIDGLCGNTTYQFTADIINLIQIGVGNHIDPNVAFLLDDQVKYETGLIEKTNKWKTFGFTFTTQPNKTSIKLSLRNNAPGGIGNDLALDNITFKPCGPSAFIGVSANKTQFLCIDSEPFKVQASISNSLKNEFIWQISKDKINWKDIAKGQVDFVVHNQFIPGNYYYRYFSAGDDLSLNNIKCRVVSEVIHISVLPRIFNIKDTICEGNFFQFGAKNIYDQGSYIDTFISTKSCDSIVYLDLHKIPNPQINIIFNIKNPSCFNYEDGAVSITNISNGAPPYKWFLNDKPYENIEITNIKSGKYKLKVIDRNLCSGFEELELINPEKFTLAEIKDIQINLGDEIPIKLISNYNLKFVKWNPEDIFLCSSCFENVAIPQKSSKIKVFGISVENCIDSITFFVNVNKDKVFAISNIMKIGSFENGNLVFSTYKKSVSQINSFEIYDRFGNLVHRKANERLVENPFKLWDGKINNTIVETGVYTYFLNLLLSDQTSLKLTGNVTLIK